LESITDLKQAFRDQLPINPGSVGRTEVDDPDTIGILDQSTMVAGDGPIGENDVTIVHAANETGSFLQVKDKSLK
jgi:hypothetical protein